jgi:hypothetical protein
MKTKRNTKNVTYKRNKNKKLIRQSLKHKNNKFTRKIIQKGGDWIQPLFYIYGNNEMNLDNCRIIDYNPYKDDYLDFQERNTTLLKGMFTTRNTDETAICINKYKFFNTYFLPFDKQLYYLNIIQQFKTANVSVDRISKTLLLGYLNVIRYFRKIWETTDIRTLETHIRSQQFQLYAGNNAQNILVDGNLNRTKQNLYNIAFSLLSPTITEAFASGNDCYFMNNIGFQIKNKNFIWMYYFSNLSLLSKIKNETMKLANYKFTHEMRDSYYEYVRIKEPEDLLSLFQNYKPYIYPINFENNYDISSKFVLDIYGRANSQGIRTDVDSFLTTYTLESNFYSIVMDTSSDTLNKITSSDMIITQITEASLVTSNYKDVIDNLQVDDIDPTHSLFKYDLVYGYEFTPEKSNELLRIQQTEKDSLENAIHIIWGDSFIRPSEFNINNNEIKFPFIPLPGEHISAIELKKQNNFISLFLYVMFDDIQEQDKDFIKNELTQIIDFNSTQNRDTRILNLQLLNELLQKLKDLNIITLDINVYIEKLTNFVRKYQLTRMPFSINLLQSKILMSMSNTTKMVAYGGVFSKYCDNSNYCGDFQVKLNIINCDALFLPRGKYTKKKYISIIDAFINQYTDGKVRNYIRNNTNSVNNNTREIYDYFVYDSNLRTSYSIFTHKIDSTMVEIEDIISGKGRIANIFYVVKMDGNNILKINNLIMWNNKNPENSSYFISLFTHSKSLYRCFNTQFFIPIFTSNSQIVDIDEPDIDLPVYEGENEDALWKQNEDVEGDPEVGGKKRKKTKIYKKYKK